MFLKSGGSFSLVHCERYVGGKQARMRARVDCLPVSERTHTRAHVTSIQVPWHSNNGTVVRLPFFRDNRWSPFLERLCPHSMQHGPHTA